MRAADFSRTVGTDLDPAPHHVTYRNADTGEVSVAVVMAKNVDEAMSRCWGELNCTGSLSVRRMEGETIADLRELAEKDGMDVTFLAEHPEHDCEDEAVPYESDGALGHGWECGVCGRFLQAG